MEIEFIFGDNLRKRIVFRKRKVISYIKTQK